MASTEMRGFEDLDCYKLALQVLMEAYRTALLLPGEERFNLVDQLRRAGVSITLNIAEGYGRYHDLDTLRFYEVHIRSTPGLERTLPRCLALPERVHSLCT